MAKLDSLASLSPEERELAIKILRQYSQDGKSDLMKELEYGDYEEVPVDIDTFLDDPRYLGTGLWEIDLVTGQKRCTLFPFWRETLHKLFPNNVDTAYNTLILTGCLGYDTEIPLLDGTTVKIGDLAKQALDGKLTNKYVYSFDVETNQYVPGHLVNAFSTGTKDVYRITLDNGQTIEATVNHKFLTRDKHWKSIESGLAVNDSLMPFYTENKPIYKRDDNRQPSDYQIIKHPQKDGSFIEEPVHRMVMRYKMGEYKGVVHHKDYNRFNNNPNNLQLMSWIEHKMFHARRGGRQWEEFNKKRRNHEIPAELEQRIKEGGLKGLQHRWADPEQHLRASKRVSARMLDGFAKHMASRAWSNEHWASMVATVTKNITIANKSKENINKYQISKAIKVANLALRDFGILSEETYQNTKLKYNMRSGYPAYSSILKRISYDELLNRAKNYNHTIIKIEYLGKQEVFDLTVERYHNFAIGAGIVAHNSIGIGKTLCACAAMCYMLYRMLCLKDPYAHYGLMPMDKITFSMLNITLDAAKGVGWGKIQSLLQGSSWFMNHGAMNASSVNPQWQPKNGIELIFGSNNNHVVGRALFCLDGDTEVVTTDGTTKIKDLVGKEFRPISVNGKGRLTKGDLCSAMPTARARGDYEIHLADGSVVKCTPNHRLMLTDGRYKEAADLTPGDELLSFAEAAVEAAGGALKVISITERVLQDEKQFYDVIDAGPWHNFLIKAASGYVVSHNCNFIDEINFKPGAIEKQQKQAGKLVAQIDARMQSRFMRGTSLPTLNIIASSKNTEQSFLDNYINTKRDNSSKTTLIIDEPQWVVRTDKGTPDDPGSFYVAVGNKFMAHELLPKGSTAEDAEAYKAKGYHVIKVPPGYREAFEDNLDQALMDIAGISSTSSTKFISGQRLNTAKRKYLNPFLKDIIEVGNAPDDHLQYANFFDLSRVSPKDISKPLFIHLDLSVSGDKTGVSGVWIVGKKPGEGSDELGSKELMYKLAFSVSVKAPKGYQVSFEKTRNFVRWLRDRGFAVKSVSADTFQSYAVLQELSNDGFKTKITSVDRVDAKSHKCLPYEYLKSMIYEQKLQLYEKCDLLSEELVNLEKLPSGKVDHPTNGSKDQSDAVCGALFDASQFSDQYSYEYGDSVDAAFEVNSEPASAELKRKYVEDFQSDLAKSYLDAFMEAQRSDEALKRSDMSSYIDVSGGIIAI